MSYIVLARSFIRRRKSRLELGLVHPDGDPSKQSTLFVQTAEGKNAVRLNGLQSTIAEAAMRRNAKVKCSAER
jgi:hypothetical protein